MKLLSACGGHFRYGSTGPVTMATGTEFKRRGKTKGSENIPKRLLFIVYPPGVYSYGLNSYPKNGQLIVCPHDSVLFSKAIQRQFSFGRSL
jgi:hypothetical protein